VTCAVFASAKRCAVFGKKRCAFFAKKDAPFSGGFSKKDAPFSGKKMRRFRSAN